MHVYEALFGLVALAADRWYYQRPLVHCVQRNHAYNCRVV
jgi:hypothetical protein